jgi:hypothetical protein
MTAEARNSSFTYQAVDNPSSKNQSGVRFNDYLSPNEMSALTKQ